MDESHAEQMAKLSQGKNRRRFARVALDTHVSVKLGEVGFESRLKDISVNGVFILTSETRPIGTGLEVSINLSEGGRQIRARGIIVHEVVREEATPRRPAGIGVMFLEVQEGEDVLRQLVAANIPVS